MNILLFRKDLNLGVTIEALESKNLLQMLAEPNVMATNGKAASFLSGGQFPVPVGQSSGPICRRHHHSIRALWNSCFKFLPQITPRGTIMLSVTPEVSSLDFANSVTIAGTTVPAMTVRRIDTVVELEPGQSFVIAGLLDNETTRTLSKIPGLGDIPLLGKLFQSRQIKKSNTELLVIVTPELVRPIPADQNAPELKFTDSFLPSNSGFPMRQPGMDKTGPVPVHPPSPTMPLEQLIQQQTKQQAPGGPSQLVNSPPLLPGAAPPAGALGTAPATSPPPGVVK